MLERVPASWAADADAAARTRAARATPCSPNLLWESIVGAWPASRERLHDYARRRRARPGPRRVDDPERRVRAAMHAMSRRGFRRPRGDARSSRTRRRGSRGRLVNALTAKLMQLTAPGVPDVYQGSELWERLLVDPDNRRAVDFGLRRGCSPSWMQADSRRRRAGAAKLLVTSRALRLRRDRPELFTRYAPLPVVGRRRPRHAVAFDRGGHRGRRPASRSGSPERRLGRHRAGAAGRPVARRHLTGRQFDGGRRPRRPARRYPVALLAPDRRVIS